jgi:hypothetical protein
MTLLDVLMLSSLNIECSLTLKVRTTSIFRICSTSTYCPNVKDELNADLVMEDFGIKSLTST